jgi:hypothetical protein
VATFFHDGTRFCENDFSAFINNTRVYIYINTRDNKRRRFHLFQDNIMNTTSDSLAEVDAAGNGQPPPPLPGGATSHLFNHAGSHYVDAAGNGPPPLPPLPGGATSHLFNHAGSHYYHHPPFYHPFGQPPPPYAALPYHIPAAAPPPPSAAPAAAHNPPQANPVGFTDTALADQLLVSFDVERSLKTQRVVIPHDILDARQSKDGKKKNSLANHVAKLSPTFYKGEFSCLDATKQFWQLREKATNAIRESIKSAFVIRWNHLCSLVKGALVGHSIISHPPCIAARPKNNFKELKQDIIMIRSTKIYNTETEQQIPDEVASFVCSFVLHVVFTAGYSQSDISLTEHIIKTRYGFDDDGPSANKPDDESNQQTKAMMKGSNDCFFQKAYHAEHTQLRKELAFGNGLGLQHSQKDESGAKHQSRTQRNQEGKKFQYEFPGRPNLGIFKVNTQTLRISSTAEDTHFQQALLRLEGHLNKPTGAETNGTSTGTSKNNCFLLNYLSVCN